MTTLLAPPFPAFDEYMARSGDTLPDFDSMRSCAALPPLLEFVDGRWVQTEEDGRARRDGFYGTFPATPPTFSKAELLAEEQEYRGTRRQLRLTFDCPTQLVSFDIELLIPDGDEHHPVFVTQPPHLACSLTHM